MRLSRSRCAALLAGLLLLPAAVASAGDPIAGSASIIEGSCASPGTTVVSLAVAAPGSSLGAATALLVTTFSGTAAVGLTALVGAPHALVVRGQPCERGAAFRRTQRLLERPEGVLRLATAHDMQPREIEPACRERRRVRTIGWRDPHDVAPLRLHARERRQREADLADAFLFQQHFRQRALRPAATGQHGVQRREAGGQGRRFRRAGVAAPDRGMRKQGGEGGGRHN